MRKSGYSDIAFTVFLALSALGCSAALISIKDIAPFERVCLSVFAIGGLGIGTVGLGKAGLAKLKIANNIYNELMSLKNKVLGLP